MGLFSRLFHKKEEVKEKIKPPKFSDLPEYNFPSYETAFPSSSETIKEAVGISKPLEKRKPLAPSEEKEIFVKIEEYKSAIDTLEIIKEKLKTAEVVLSELHELKKKEEAELEEWQDKIDNIKEKLKLVDNNLFL